MAGIIAQGTAVGGEFSFVKICKNLPEAPAKAKDRVESSGRVNTIPAVHAAPQSTPAASGA